jgi:opine dehydrogenase
MLTALRAPGHIETRWLTEDIPFGLATWALLGDQLGVETPVIDSLVTLASATLGRDFRSETRGLDALGMSQMSEEALRARASGIAG